MKSKILNIKIAFFACIVALFSTFASCDKLPQDGDLDAMWQLMSVSNNGNVTDFKAQKVYWSFRNGLAQFTKPTHGYRLYANFIMEDEKQLYIRDFAEHCAYNGESTNNEWLLYSKKDTLNIWGIIPEQDIELPEKGDYKLKADFSILELNSKKMVLADKSGAMLVFRKF